MKKKLVILVASIIILICGCTKNDELQIEEVSNESNMQESIYYEQTSKNIETVENDNITEEYTNEEVEVLDESYTIREILGHKDDLYISETEKFWVWADYYNEQTKETDMVYILTDAYWHIYKVLNDNIGLETVISENILVIRDSSNSRHYRIIDGDGNDISLKYINEGEIILGVFNNDNNINIFTVSTEDTYSTQNVIFKIYDENKNCKFSFSKKEINDKYGVEWVCNVETLSVSDLGNEIYCPHNIIYNSVIEHSIYLSNPNNLEENMGLYIDMNREKVFLAGKGGNASDGKYIWCEDSVIDIDSETTTYLEGGTLKYRNTYAHRNSNIWNGKFITNTNAGAYLYSSDYAIYDCQGNLVCDLESDTVNVTNYSGIYNGYSLIEITNEGGTKYITIIDENGEWQFEPIQGQIVWHQYIKSTEQFVVVKNDYTDLILINTSGEQEELPIPVVEGIGYKGVVLMQTETGIQYILYNTHGRTTYQKETAETKIEMNQEDFIIDWKDEHLEDAMRQVTGITDRNIMLSDVIELEELDLYFTEVENIDSLKYLTNLRELHLVSGKYMPNGASFSSLEDDTPLDLSALSNLTKLKTLKLEGKKIKDIKAVTNLKNLEFFSIGNGELCLYPTMVSDISPLANLINLKILYLSSAQITNLEPLANLTNLERLDVSYNKITDITPIFNLNHLTWLQLNGTTITDINGLNVLHQLKELDLGDTPVTYIEPLKGLTNLETIALYETDISNLNVLTELSQLSYLGLYHANVTDFDTIKNLKNLKSLDLRENNINNVDFLKNLTNLEDLYLSNNSITNIEPLSNLTNLKYLNIAGNPITDYSPVAFVETVLKD